jgi:hypothetical protein
VARRLHSRKLLVASCGVASVTTLGGCEEEGVVTGNLMPLPATETQPEAAPSAPEAAPTSSLGPAAHGTSSEPGSPEAAETEDSE